MKRLLACMLAIFLLQTILPGTVAETADDVKTISGIERTEYPSGIPYTVTESGEILPGGKTLQPASPAGAPDGEQPMDAEQPEESAVAGIDPAEDISSISSGIMATETGMVPQLTYEDIQAMNPDSTVIAVFSNNGNRYSPHSGE